MLRPFARPLGPAHTALTVGITGASGFVGRALVQRHLDAGHAVRGLTRGGERALPAGVQPFAVDLERPGDGLARFADGLDVLYHCAGVVSDPSRMRAVNVDGTAALLRASAGRVGRWVQLSSAGVYGRPRTGTISEDTPLAPVTPYERTKADAEALVLEAARAGALASSVVLRPSIVFGHGMPNRSVSQLMAAIRRGLFFYIGDPGASANYVHVSNVADALVLCGTRPEADGRIYNLSDWCTVEAFAGAIADALACPRPRLRVPETPVRCAVRVLDRVASLPLTESRLDALVNRARYSIARIQRDLHYRAQVSISSGLADMVAREAAA